MGSTDCFCLAQGRNRWLAVVNAVTNLRVAQNVRNSLAGWGLVGFSGRLLFHGVSWFISK
jgi:hypothetical protein